MPGLPAYIIFMCVRHIDHLDDDEKVEQSGTIAQIFFFYKKFKFFFFYKKFYKKKILFFYKNKQIIQIIYDLKSLGIRNLVCVPRSDMQTPPPLKKGVMNGAGVI